MYQYSIPLLWLNNIPVYGYEHILSIHSSVDEHLGNFYFLAVMNNATERMIW